MLSLVAIAVVLLHYTQAVCASAHCDTSAQCQADECCVTVALMGGRRYIPETLFPSLKRQLSGTCQKRGTDTINRYCHVNSRHPSTDGLYYSCPCMTGFTCKGTGMYDMPLGELGLCTAEPVQVGRATGSPCNSGADCADNECCVNSIRPIGRRGDKRLFMQATCQPMGTDGSSCFVHQGSGKPDSTVFQCPCSSGLTCHGSGMFDVPLGEVGTCGK